MDKSRGNGNHSNEEGKLGWLVLSCLETARQPKINISFLYWKPALLFKDIRRAMNHKNFMFQFCDHSPVFKYWKPSLNLCSGDYEVSGGCSKAVRRGSVGITFRQASVLSTHPHKRWLSQWQPGGQQCSL